MKHVRTAVWGWPQSGGIAPASTACTRGTVSASHCGVRVTRSDRGALPEVGAATAADGDGGFVIGAVVSSVLPLCLRARDCSCSRMEEAATTPVAPLLCASVCAALPHNRRDQANPGSWPEFPKSGGEISTNV